MDKYYMTVSVGLTEDMAAAIEAVAKHEGTTFGIKAHDLLYLGIQEAAREEA